MNYTIKTKAGTYTMIFADSVLHSDAVAMAKQAFGDSARIVL